MTASDRAPDSAVSAVPAGRRVLSSRRRAVLCFVLVAIPALLLYLRTMMPDIGFWDTGEFQAIGPVLGIAHPTGYPAYTLLAWVASVFLQPFGNEAFRANLLSALLVAAACGTLGVTVAYLTRRLVVGVGVGIAFAVCTEAWAIGLHADPHALHLLLATVLLLILVVWGQRKRASRPDDRWLIAAAATFGVSLANHGLTLLLAPGIGLYVLAVDPGILRRWRVILACVGALVVATVGLYAYLPIRSAMNPPMDYANPETWDGFRYLVFAEQFRGTFHALPGVLEAVRLIVHENFEQLGLLYVLAAAGLVFGLLRRPALVLLLVVWFAINWWFALGYVNADIGRYYLVPLLSVAVLGGIGAGAILETTRSLVARITPARQRMARLAIAGLAALVLIGPAVASIPAHLATIDESGDRSAREWLNQVGATLPPDSVVVSWWSYSTPLWYAQYVEQWRPDVTVIDDRTMLDQHLGTTENVLDSYLGKRPLYLLRLSSDLARFENEYVLAKVPDVLGGLYEVSGRRPAAGVANL